MDGLDGLIGVTGSECAWYQARILYPNFEVDCEAPTTAKDGDEKKRTAASCMAAMVTVLWGLERYGEVSSGFKRNSTMRKTSRLGTARPLPFIYQLTASNERFPTGRG